MDNEKFTRRAFLVGAAVTISTVGGAIAIAKPPPTKPPKPTKTPTPTPTTTTTATTTTPPPSGELVYSNSYGNVY